MKPIAFVAAFLVFSIFCIAQNSGKIISVNPTAKAGEENVYQYQPPAGLALPDKLAASIVYTCNGYHYKTVAINKTGDGYQFSVKFPDSTTTCIMGIIDDQQAIVDNNLAAGYVFYMYDKTGKRFETAGVDAAGLLSGYAPYKLKLSPQSPAIVAIYEDEYKMYPAVKKNSYASYLQVLYSIKGDTVKPQLLAYAKHALSEKGSEKEWNNALMIYQMLKMDSASDATSKKILSAYPAGTLALNKFWEKFYQDKDKTADKGLSYLHEYVKQFKDSSAPAKDQFYEQAMSFYAGKKDWANMKKYDALITNKTITANLYNSLAWGMSGQDLNSEGSELELASYFANKAMQGRQQVMDDPKVNDDDKEIWKEEYYNDVDTYALILYKLKKYDSAFYYEDMVLTKGHLDVGGTERYAAYAEKAKGAAFVRPYIEQQLVSGSNSTLLQKQLQAIYAELNLSAESYKAIIDKATIAAKQKNIAAIKAVLGSTEGKDFDLKDLDGNTVTLASVKNKVVVLDFWATWCGPCRASFPAMQQVVNKYKDDKDVVFLFVDVWERDDTAAIKKNVAKFIKDNNYTFQVLIDDKNKMGSDYKVEAIPDKFVIDRTGNIVMMGHEISDLAAVIEAAKG